MSLRVKVMYSIAAISFGTAIGAPILLSECPTAASITDSFQDWQAITAAFTTLSAGVLAYTGSIKQVEQIRQSAEEEESRKREEKDNRERAAIISVAWELKQMDQLMVALLNQSSTDKDAFAKVMGDMIDLAPNTVSDTSMNPLQDRMVVVERLKDDQAIAYSNAMG